MTFANLQRAPKVGTAPFKALAPGRIHQADMGHQRYSHCDVAGGGVHLKCVEGYLYHERSHRLLLIEQYLHSTHRVGLAHFLFLKN